MSTKIYLHLDKAKNQALPQLDNFTAAYTLTETVTLRQLYNVFLQLYQQQHPTNVLSATVQTHGTDVLYILHNTSNTKITDPDTVINTLVSDKDDIFICVNSAKFRQKHDAVQARAKQADARKQSEQPDVSIVSTDVPTDIVVPSADTVDAGSKQLAAANGADAVVASNSDQITTQEALVLSLLSQARNQQHAAMLRKASDIYKSALHTIDSVQPLTARLRSFKQIIYQQLGVMELYNRRYKSAIEYFNSAHSIATQIHAQFSSDSALQQAHAQGKLTEEDRQLLKQLPALKCLLGQALLHNRQYVQALKYFQQAEQYYSMALDKATDAAVKQQKQADLFDVRVYIARTMYAYSTTAHNPEHNYSKQQLDTIVQYRQKAIDLYEQLMKLNEHNVNLLVHYASIAVDVQQANQAIPYLLRAVVDAAQQGNSAHIDKQSKLYGQQMLANVTRSQWGIQQLLHDLHSASDNSAALGFLAFTLKEHGNINGALVLYERAVQQLRVPLKLEPKSIDKPAADTHVIQQYTLDEIEINMTLNLCHTYEVAAQYQHVFDTIKYWFATHSAAKIGAYSCKPFYAAICNIRDIYDTTLTQCTSELAAKYVAICDIVETDVLPSDTPLHGDASMQQSQLNSHPTFNQLPYTIEELNILGLMFTCVKCLYNVGALQPIPAIANLMEPLRKGKNLHMTIIRNEHAYYSTCVQLLHAYIERYNKIDLFAQVKHFAADCIYVVGDSHSLSCAWHTIAVQNHTYTMIPKLVTGVKLWHLRAGSTFYTRNNFDYVLSTVPQNAVCLFVLGEIDCRDGIQQSVDKYKNNSLADAIQYNVQLYTDLLHAVKKQKQCRAILVHPVVPVLDVTRQLVTQYNSVLKKAVSDSSLLKLNVHYMDIYDKLLNTDKSTNHTEFNSEYKLDGTHMHPKYTELIQQWCTANKQLKL